MTSQLVQIIGALLVLTAFVLSQWRVLDAKSVPYLLLNAAGGTVLAVLAFAERQWGFLLLESVWAAVSVRGLVSAHVMHRRLHPGLRHVRPRLGERGDPAGRG